ncbi:hypothetical protein VBD025_03940 [Virgibacillus flavescens]|uniref:hypothetical protein n=1 Tax=Virgibacillus flavescens TaxID=1611422 RepID=UPI003D33F04A
MMNQDRKKFIQDYYRDKQGLIKVEVPVYISKTIKGTIHHYFNGERAGYTFKQGIAYVEKKDLHKFKAFPYMIIHTEKGADIDE